MPATVLAGAFQFGFFIIITSDDIQSFFIWIVMEVPCGFIANGVGFARISRHVVCEKAVVKIDQGFVGAEVKSQRDIFAAFFPDP